MMRHAVGMYWIPRIAAIVYGVFLAMFALDAFSGEASFGKKLADFVLHLVPVLMYGLIVAVAWRWQAIGAVLFASLGVLYIFTVRGRLDWSLLIAGPLFLMAGLFLAEWLRSRQRSA